MVSLVFLVILTILGLGAMRSALLETKIAGNAQFQTTALANAEVQLKKAEDDIDALVLDASAKDFYAPSDQYYFVDDPADDIDPADLEWAFSKAASSPDAYYVIEYTGPHSISGESIAAGTPIPGSAVHVYLISAKSQVASGANRTAQTVYVTQDAP